jgi:hypothetical protein
MATARKAMGTALKRGDGGGSEVFTTIGRMRNFTGPGLSQDVIDVTDLGNVTGYAEYLLGLKDGGEITCELTWDPADAQHAAILATDFESQVLRDFQMDWANSGVTWSFVALVSKFSPKGDPKSALTADLTLKITGAINFDA